MRIVRLEQNYRSTKRILRIADELIGHNVRRKQKALWTENDEGAPVRLTRYADQDDEATAIAEQIRDAIAGGPPQPSDFAIFYRVNALSRAVEQALRRRACRTRWSAARSSTRARKSRTCWPTASS